MAGAASATDSTAGLPSPNTVFQTTSAAGNKRKRDAASKFYAVRRGHMPGIYHSYEDCLQQVKGFSSAQFKAFGSETEAEAFIRNGPNAAARFTTKAPKFYGVRAGHAPGVYTDWPSAQRQVQGFVRAKHRSFSTRALAQSFVNEQDVQDVDAAGEKSKAKKPAVSAMFEIDETVEPGSGPLPPISDDGFDSRISLDEESGNIRYKTEAEKSATKVQSVGLVDGGWIEIYTDGSSLGNGQQGSYAGVGVYFGPKDSRNASEPLKGLRQTNQRAELTAIKRAIEIAPIDRNVRIFSDSKYAISCVTEWFQDWRANDWKTKQNKAVQNRDLVEPIVRRLEERDGLRAKTKFQWLKGHAEDPGNTAADALAVTAARMAKSEGGSRDVAAD